MNILSKKEFIYLLGNTAKYKVITKVKQLTILISYSNPNKKVSNKLGTPQSKSFLTHTKNIILKRKEISINNELKNNKIL
jgi:hypothetical protein